MRSALLSTAVYLIFLSKQAMFSQAHGPDPPASEHDEIHLLNERIASQDAHLAAQQAQIDTLQSGLAEQKALIEKLIQSREIALSSHAPEQDALLLSTQVNAVKNGQPAVFKTAVIKQEQPKAPMPEQAAALRNEQKEQPNPKPPKQWFDKYSIRGYMQIRFNNIVATNSKYTCDQCDKGIGPNDKFFLRRMRVVISGNVTDRVSIYLQPDFASSTSDTNNIAQLRDAYFDVALDSKKQSRFRTGLSKVPSWSAAASKGQETMANSVSACTTGKRSTLHRPMIIFTTCRVTPTRSS
jgi:hypothetical protein